MCEYEDEYVHDCTSPFYDHNVEFIPGPRSRSCPEERGPVGRKGVAVGLCQELIRREAGQPRTVGQGQAQHRSSSVLSSLEKTWLGTVDIDTVVSSR